MGQVGQESNLQPAVLEHSARCPDSSKNVQPVCSQFCSQDHILGGMPKQSGTLISPGCRTGKQVT
jgi:hypothetical protein